MDPATKQDLKEAIADLKLYILDREISAVRWFVGVQLTYFTLVMGITLGAMYFMLQHFTRLPPP
jgi:hypothetical protein